MQLSALERTVKRLGKTIIISLMTVIAAYPVAELDAQEIRPGKVYVVTHEPVTEDNRYRGQTATIWQVDVASETGHQLLSVDPTVNQAPRALFPASEIAMLEESNWFPPGRADEPGVTQGLDTVVPLDAEHLLVVVYRQVREVMSDTSSGYYDLRLLDLIDGDVTSMLTLPYHPSVIDTEWGCTPGDMINPVFFQPNPVLPLFAFSIVPVNSAYCGHGDLGQTVLVDYGSLPVQVDVLPFVREISWSPNGSQLAYIQTPCPEFSSEPCVASVHTRPAPLGSASSRVIEYVSPSVYPKLITWLDDETILYQYDEYKEFEDRAHWAAYNVTTGQEIFDEILRDGAFGDFGYLHSERSHLIWGWRDGLVLMRFSDTIEIVDRLSTSYFTWNSRFNQYVILGRSFEPKQVLAVDGTVSPLDLTWFRAAVPNESIMYAVPGAGKP